MGTIPPLLHGVVVIMDNSLKQERMPVHEALINWQNRGIVRLHMPAHKGTPQPPEMKTFFTTLGLACDLPSMDATDNWFHPTGCIREAQRLAADLYGAADTFYLVNGSTIGVQAMLLAAVSPGEEIVTSRHMHLSAFSALVLTGAVPRYLPCRWVEAAGPIPATTDEVAAYLTQYPNARAVLLTNPTYYGVGRDLESIARLCRNRGVALLVDEAHGAHLHWLPPGNLRSALDCGADLVVQSVHKTVGSLVGTAQLHRSTTSLIPKERLQAALNLLQSTSSSYLLLASLDIVRRWTWKHGYSLFHDVVSLTTNLRERIAAVDGLRVLDVNRFPSLGGCIIDPLRLTIDVSGLALSGFEVERILLDQFQLYGEFCDLRNVVFALGPGDTSEIVGRLEHAMRSVAASVVHRDRCIETYPRCSRPPPLVLLPREAVFRQKKRVPIDDAIGRISGETISVYPPGIPLICPGERFTADVIGSLTDLIEQNACIFSEDRCLRSVTVIDSSESCPVANYS